MYSLMHHKWIISNHKHLKTIFSTYAALAGIVNSKSTVEQFSVKQLAKLFRIWVTLPYVK